jgi:hypothetical protein
LGGWEDTEVTLLNETDKMERVHELYSLPLAEFTRARNELAKSLKEEGDAEGAGLVAKLAKPSIAAWAVNQLARCEAGGIDELLSLRERLGAAEEPDEIRKLATRRHQLISDLTERSRSVLEGAGHAASSQTLAKVSATLYGANDDAELEALKNGTLTRELEASGFEDVTGLDWNVAETEAPEPRSIERDEKARRERAELEAEIEEAERDAVAREKEARRALRAAELATGEAENARARVERLRARLEKH